MLSSSWQKLKSKIMSINHSAVNVSPARSPLGVVREESQSAGASFDTLEPSDARPDNRSDCVSPASSNGGVYSVTVTIYRQNFVCRI